MKKSIQELLSKRKIILIFLIAILLPSLVVGYLSLSTIAKRRETLKKFIESNLWISGESALKSLEEKLLDYENQILKSENFNSIFQIKQNNQAFSNYIQSTTIDGGRLFLLDDKFQTIFLKSGQKTTSVFQWEEASSPDQFSQLFQKAQSLEFSQKNYTQAVEIYRECGALAPSKQNQALALEGQGRCLFLLKNYTKAYETYRELSSNYSQLYSRADHPYGIVAAFQLFHLEQSQNRMKKSYEILLEVYRKMRKGIWLLNTPVYDFFSAEIESIFESSVNGEKFSEIQQSFKTLRQEQSPYRQALEFTDFLEQNVVPRLKGRSLNSQISLNTPERFLMSSEKELCFISFRTLPDFKERTNFLGGFWWDINALRTETVPSFAEEIKKKSGLDIQILDESGQSIIPYKEKLTSSNSLSFSFRRLPLQWKLAVSQPELKNLEKTARREIILYGILITVIVALMILGAVLIARDISRESETTRLKTEFVHNISHELKTPLTLIRLYGETLQRKEDLPDNEKLEAYEIITKESERLSLMINNVLDFSRIEMGRKEFNFKKGNLAQVLKDTLESYRYHLEKKGFTIQEEITSKLPEMSFDSDAVASVFVNLLSNAMKFSPKKKEVNVRLFQKGKNVVLQVIDKGIGVESKDISKIFQRFYRAKDNTSSETGGSGLGLTLAQHIVEAHGGEIKVESEPGKRSTFSVILPIDGPEK